MSIQDLTRTTVLNNIPKKKLLDYISNIDNSNDDLNIKATKKIIINRYAESNIPIEYWNITMEKDFVGDQRLLNKYKEYIEDLKDRYINGTSICFAGHHGVGKTMTATCILKKASQKGYSCLYTTLSDIVNTLNQSPSEDKFFARRELILIDFLVIDEFDSRFMASDNAADLYARHLESIFRTRIQNKLPTLMCTNSPNIVESFNGPLKNSIDSLIKGYLHMFPVLGQDIRKNKVKN